MLSRLCGAAAMMIASCIEATTKKIVPNKIVSALIDEPWALITAPRGGSFLTDRCTTPKRTKLETNQTRSFASWSVALSTYPTSRICASAAVKNAGMTPTP